MLLFYITAKQNCVQAKFLENFLANNEKAFSNILLKFPNDMKDFEVKQIKQQITHFRLGNT